MNLSRIKNVFKIGKKTKSVSARLVEIEFQGKKQKAVIMMPYGMFMNPADDSPAGILSDQCNEESLYAMIFDIANQETNGNLDDGEIAFGIPSLSSRIFFRKNGDIEMSNDNGTMTLKASGQFDVNGNFTVDP